MGATGFSATSFAPPAEMFTVRAVNGAPPLRGSHLNPEIGRYAKELPPVLLHTCSVVGRAGGWPALHSEASLADKAAMRCNPERSRP